MSGRPPVPTALKIMRGNPGKRALPQDEPKPEAVEPVRPGNLSERALIEWDKMAPILIRMRVLTEADGYALGMLCSAIAELDDVNEAIRKTGSLVQNRISGAVKLNPLLLLRSELNRRVVTGFREFGMTPAARTKVRTTGSGAPTKMFDLTRNATEAG